VEEQAKGMQMDGRQTERIIDTDFPAKNIGEKLREIILK
jgi:hypothetical protein